MSAPPMKDEDICVLQALVKKDSGHASFSLNLEQLGQDRELKMECLQAYARPWDGEAPDEAVGEWKLTMQINYDPLCWRTFSLGDFEKGEAVRSADLVERLSLEFQSASRGAYLAFKEKLSISYAGPDRAKCVLVLPPNWFLEFADLEAGKALGFYGQLSVMASIEETDHGSLRIANNDPKHTASVVGGPVSNSIKASRAGRMSAKAGPLQPSTSESYAAPPPELKMRDINQWVNTGLATLLTAASLDVHLLACAVYSSSRLQLVSNQSLGEIPFSADLSFNDKMASDLHEQARTTRFHFGLKRHEALVRGLVDSHELGSWRTDNSKGAVPWSDPLQEIAPFYLVSDALDGGSFLSKQGNVSVVASVGKSMRAQIAIPMKIRGRAGKINLKVLDSEMNECQFRQNFKFFIVFRMS